MYGVLSTVIGVIHLAIIVVGLILTRGTARALMAAALGLFVVGWAVSFGSGGLIGASRMYGLVLYSAVSGIISLAGTACLVAAAIVAVRASRPVAPQWGPQGPPTPGGPYPPQPYQPGQG